MLHVKRTKEHVVKRILILMMVVGLVFGSIATADAKKKKKVPTAPVRIERVVEIPYDHPSVGAVVLGRGGGYPVGFPEAMEIPVSSEETYFKIEVTDQSGQKVAGYIGQGDVDGNGLNDDLYGDFCGAHPEALPLAAPGMPIVGVYAYSGTCADGTPSVMTTGVIKITLSNMP